MKQIAVKQVPDGQRAGFPSVLIGPPYKCEPADKPSDRHWTFELQLWWKNGRHSFVIWRLVGRQWQDEDVLDALRAKAMGLGVCCVWIYSVSRPLNRETIQYINHINTTKPWKN